MSTIQEDPRVHQLPSDAEPGHTPPARPPHRRHRLGPAVAAAAALLVLVVVLAFGATRLSVGQAQTDPQVSAIENVIQQANAEQAQALSTNNPSLMSDTGTAAYYRQLVQINQDLQAQGVASIQLTNLAWGAIAVNGTTATANTTETWVTTLKDGTTTESTDPNVYTLVQQNGQWLIEADQQPGSGQQPTAQATPGTQPPATPLPAVPASEATSHNWSGYAAAGGQTFTAVSGTWTVPQVASTGAPGVGATWVGIGGVNSRDLIQAGTQDVASGNGLDQFQTWIELLPAPSRQVPLAVAPGDSISVSITESGVGSGQWQIVMKNNTSGQSYQTTVQYTSSQSSAEWIEEAPASSNSIVPLDNFGTVAFSGATAVENGQSVDLTQAGAQPITMLNATNQPLAVPSAVGSNGSSFSVTRTSAVATTTRIGGAGARPGGPRSGTGG